MALSIRDLGPGFQRLDVRYSGLLEGGADPPCLPSVPGMVLGPQGIQAPETGAFRGPRHSEGEPIECRDGVGSGVSLESMTRGCDERSTV